MHDDRLSETHLAAWRVFLTSHRRIVDAIDRELQASGRLPLSSYDALIELYEAPERRLRMAELARRVVLSRSGLTRLIDRLEAEGLLTRDRSADDRRGAYAVITPQGVEALRQAWPLYARGIQTFFASHLTPDEAQALRSMLSRMTGERPAD